jgi:hypothetical protein
MWYQERKNKSRNSAQPKYNMCCSNGNVQMPFFPQPLPLLQHLMFDHSATESKKFKDNIRLSIACLHLVHLAFKLIKELEQEEAPYYKNSR